MVKDGQRKIHTKPLSLLLVEGDTEEIFYSRIKTYYLENMRTKVDRKLEGLFNINKKIINRILTYARQNDKELIRVYCCIDRESRYNQVPEFDINWIKERIRIEGNQQVLSIDAIIATKQIESWFFYDIEGIYDFLRASNPRRNPQKYKPPERFGKKDLQRLFEQFDKKYIPGKDSTNFINSLDIKRIAENCNELREGINLITSLAGNQTNYIFTSGG